MVPVTKNNKPSLPAGCHKPVGLGLAKSGAFSLASVYVPAELDYGLVVEQVRKWAHAVDTTQKAERFVGFCCTREQALELGVPAQQLRAPKQRATVEVLTPCR
jgi:hypothetical protein